MSRFNVIYVEDGNYEIESLTDKREVRLFVEEWDITEYSVVVGKLLPPVGEEFEEFDTEDFGGDVEVEVDEVDDDDVVE